MLKLFLLSGCRDARTREPLSSFEAQSNTSSQEFAQNNEVLAEEKGLRKEKGVGWLQRSRNAFMGAADAVRRAAAERLGQEEARRLETLAVSEEGTVWGGFGNGHLVKWDSEGTRQQWEPLAAVAVKCLLVVGSRLWVGYANGKIEVNCLSNLSEYLIFIYIFFFEVYDVFLFLTFDSIRECGNLT